MPWNSRRWLGWFLLGAILCLNLYLYSGLHVHNRLSKQPCAFFQLENSPGLESAAAIELPPPAAGGEYVLISEFVHRDADGFAIATSRAPPQNS
jgi:hypothetical protein